MIAFTLSGSTPSIRDAITAARHFVREHGFSAGRADEVETALVEALSNAMCHGNRGDLLKPIRLTVAADSGYIVAEVHDAGPGPAGIPPLPDLSAKIEGHDRPSGWGVFLMRSLASELTFMCVPEGGHKVVLRFEALAPSDPVAPQVVREPHDK